MSQPAPDTIDPAVADLVEEFTNRLQAGEPLDVSAFVAAHPQHAARLTPYGAPHAVRLAARPRDLMNKPRGRQ